MPSTHTEPDPSESREHVSAARVLSRTLASLGVEYLFGMDAPAALQAELGTSDITPVTVRDERSAAFMADGYAKVSGKPGVLGIGGVGATDTVQGVIESWLGCTPVVLLVEEGAGATRHKNDLQDIDRGPVFASITKWVGQIEHPDRIADLTAHGFRIATSGRPGPVVIGYPWDVLSSDTRSVTELAPIGSEYPAQRVAPDPSDVQRAADMIAAAQRPAIIAGGGVIVSRATDALAELARALGAPVATTPAGKGAFDEFDPLSAGVVGSYASGAGGSGRRAHALVLGADLVIVAGTTTSSGSTANWTVPDPSQSIIHIDVDPVEIGRNYPRSFPLVGDAKLVLDALTKALGSHGSRPPWSAEHRSASSEDRPKTSAGPVGGVVNPEHLYADIQSSIDDETLIVAAAGYCAGWALDRLRFRSPGRRFIGPSAYGTLGYGLPAAIGAAFAAPASTVVCVTGDGGIGFSLAELETAVRYDIAITVIVLNNAGLGWSRHYDRHFYGYEGQTSFVDVDYAAVARALGCRGSHVSTDAEFSRAFAEAVASSSTTLIDAVIDPHARPPVDMFD